MPTLYTQTAERDAQQEGASAMPATQMDDVLADPAFDFLATAMLGAGWTDEQIIVNRGTDILYMPGDFCWLHLTEDDGACVVVPVSPRLCEDTVFDLKLMLAEMAHGAFAKLRAPGKA